MTDCKDIPRLIERLHDCKRGLTTATPDDYNQWLQALEAMQKEIKRMEMEDDGVREKLVIANQRIAELEELLALPYPPNDGKTHWENCYLDRGHHNCAVQRIAELETELKDSNRLLKDTIDVEVKQADRIAELEAQVETLQNRCAQRGLSPEDSDALEARVAELEAEVKEHVDAYQECLKRSMELEAQVKASKQAAGRFIRMIKPTMENLNDPYVLQLIETISRLEDTIQYAAAILRNDRFKDRVKNALVELDEVLENHDE